MRHSRAVPAFLASALFALGATLLPAPSAAQQAVTGDTAQAVATLAAAAAPVSYVLRPAPQRFGVQLQPAATETPAVALRDEPRTGPDVAMMAVGGAAVAAGLLIGGDTGVVLATGGAVVGLIGLYRYLR